MIIKEGDFRTKMKYKIPYIMLQNLVTLSSRGGGKNIELLYKRRGKVFYVKNAEHDPLLSNASIFQIKFLSQRLVPEEESGLCMW